MKQELLLSQLIDSPGLSLKQKYWHVLHYLATYEENLNIGVKVAELFMPLAEKKHPGNPFHENMIYTIKKYIAGLITLESLKEDKDDHVKLLAYDCIKDPYTFAWTDVHCAFEYPEIHQELFDHLVTFIKQ